MSKLGENTVSLQQLLEAVLALPEAGGEIPEGYIDTSDATATSSQILEGSTAYVKGKKITGTIPGRTASNLIASGATVTVPAGHYASQATKSVDTATQATPSISVSSAGLITATATQTAGYVGAGTKKATKQLTTQGEQTITPGTSNKTIASGRYLTGTQTIKGDANLLAENIKKGKTIFGVSGSYEGEGGSGGGTNSNVFHLVPSEYTSATMHFMHECTLDYLLSHNLTAYIYKVDVDNTGNDVAQFHAFSTADGTLVYNENFASLSGMHTFDAPGFPMCMAYIDEASAPLHGLSSCVPGLYGEKFVRNSTNIDGFVTELNVRLCYAVEIS